MLVKAPSTNFECAEDQREARNDIAVKFIDILRQRFAISGGKRHELPGGREGVILWEVEKRKWRWTNRGGSTEARLGPAPSAARQQIEFPSLFLPR